MTCTLREPLPRTKWESMLSGSSPRRSIRRIYTRRQLAVWSSRTAWTLVSWIRRACQTSIANSTTGCLKLRPAFKTATTHAWSFTSDRPLRRKECSSILRAWRGSTSAMRTGTLLVAWLRACLRRPPPSMLNPSLNHSVRRPSNNARANLISNERTNHFLMKNICARASIKHQ